MGQEVSSPLCHASMAVNLEDEKVWLSQLCWHTSLWDEGSRFDWAWNKLGCFPCFGEKTVWFPKPNSELDWESFPITNLFLRSSWQPHLSPFLLEVLNSLFLSVWEKPISTKWSWDKASEPARRDSCILPRLISHLRTFNISTTHDISLYFPAFYISVFNSCHSFSIREGAIRTLSSSAIAGLAANNYFLLYLERSTISTAPIS